MSIISGSALLLWHDIEEKAKQTFYEWHGKEHMPDRMQILGFIRARRFQSIYGEPGFLCLYEISKTDVLFSEDYTRRSKIKPSELEAIVEPNFRGIARAVCTVKATNGVVDGGLISSFRYNVNPEYLDEHSQKIANSFFPKLRTETGIASCHFLLTEEFKYIDNNLTQESRLPVNCIVIIESWGEIEKFTLFCKNLLKFNIFDTDFGSIKWGCYRLQSSLGVK